MADQKRFRLGMAIGGLTLAGLTALGINAFFKNDLPKQKMGIYQGYDVKAVDFGDSRTVSIGKDDVYVNAYDFDHDGRFDRIQITAPKGDRVEDFANQIDLEKAYKTIQSGK